MEKEIKECVSNCNPEIEVKSIHWTEHDNHKFLEVTLKRTDELPIDIKEVTNISREINKIIDKVYTGDDKFILDISA